MCLFLLAFEERLRRSEEEEECFGWAQGEERESWKLGRRNRRRVWYEEERSSGAVVWVLVAHPGGRRASRRTVELGVVASWVSFLHLRGDGVSPSFSDEKRWGWELEVCLEWRTGRVGAKEVGEGVESVVRSGRPLLEFIEIRRVHELRTRAY